MPALVQRASIGTCCVVPKRLPRRHRFYHAKVTCAASGTSLPSDGDRADAAAVGRDQSSGPPSPPPSPPSPWQRFRAFFSGGNFDRKKLASLGFSAFAAYGVVSNVNALVLITIAWLTVVKQTGQIPLAEGNWSLFVGVYAGLWISSHFLRPVRLSIALAAAPFVDRLLVWLQTRLGCNKAVSFGIVLAGIAGGSLALLLLILLVFGGFPAS